MYMTKTCTASAPSVATSGYGSTLPTGMVPRLKNLWRLESSATSTRIAAMCRQSIMNSYGENWTEINESNSAVPKKSSSSSERYKVVITGGTKGTGKALAAKFLEYGDHVIICSRDSSRVEASVAELHDIAVEFKGTIQGISADVTNGADMEKLADFAKQGGSAHSLYDMRSIK